jgi:hypothetical protein
MFISVFFSRREYQLHRPLQILSLRVLRMSRKFAISHRGLCLANHIRGRGGCRSYAHLRVLTAASRPQHHQLREYQSCEPSISPLCLFARADGLFILQPQRPIARPCRRARDARLLVAVEAFSKDICKSEILDTPLRKRYMISIGDQNIRYIINSSSIQRSCLIDLTGLADSAVMNITLAKGPMGA